MIPNSVSNFLDTSNRGLLEEAARIEAATAKGAALRELAQRLDDAASDGTIDAQEMAALRASARALGVADDLDDAFASLEASGGALDSDEAARAVGELERQIHVAVRESLGEARPSLEMQLRIQSEQTAVQLFSSTMTAYHQSAMAIIGNMKA